MQIIKSFWKPMAWAVIVIMLSLISGNDIEKIPLIKIPHIDKIAHFCMYFMLTSLLLWDFSRYKERSMSWRKIIIFSMVVAISFGGCMELLQEIHKFHRSTDIRDFIANSAGTVLAVFLFKSIENLLKKITIFTKPKNSYSL